MTKPKTERPEMPGYGVHETMDGALDWSWAEERIAACRNIFVASVRRDGRPHVMPVWGVWVHERFVFSTAITSVKSENLLKNPNMAISIEQGKDAILIEGVASIVQLDEVPTFVETYKKKYDYTIEEGPVWSMTPRVAFAFIEDDSFAQTSTRWRFDH